MEAFLNEVWAEFRPQAVTGVASILGFALMIIVGWLSLKAAAAVDAVKQDKRAASLYRTILNVLTMIVTVKSAQGVPGVLKGVDSGIIADALAKVKEQNPEAVKGLKQDDDKLRTKIIAKLPEVQASVAESAAKVQQAAQ
ncbi:hypothetical protein ACFOWB_25150 [Chenggangzhangella methanolivorans]|uniref:hypothetical protein n=1 Tax=Chenggangzhangella methanolivorans TaxID=1437009 RepID=UPI00362387DA